jgi:hypothetical protein
LISKIKFDPFSSSALLFFTYFRFPGFPTFSKSCKLDVFQNCYGTREGDVPPLPHKTRVIVSSYFSLKKKKKKTFSELFVLFKIKFLLLVCSRSELAFGTTLASVILFYCPAIKSGGDVTAGSRERKR